MSIKDNIEKQAVNEIIKWIEENKNPLSLAGGGLAGLGGLFLLSDMFDVDYLEESDDLKDLDKITVKIPKTEKSSAYNLEREINVENEISFMGNLLKKAERVDYEAGSNVPKPGSSPNSFTGPVGTTALMGLGLPLGAYGVYKLIETFAKRQKRNKINKLVRELKNPEEIEEMEKDSNWAEGWASVGAPNTGLGKLTNLISDFGSGGVDAVGTIFGGVEDAYKGVSDYIGSGEYKNISAPAISGYTGLLGGAAGLGTLLGYFALKEYLGREDEEEDFSSVNPQIVYEYGE